MISISLCMIVKNEEKMLERCLSTVHDLVDEIIIVDTGSTDKTKEIAKKFTDLIYDFEWIDDFSAARNFSFSKATKDYQMWLDADDIIEENARKKFKKLKSELKDNVDMVIIPYDNQSGESDISSTVYKRERIVKRARNFMWVGFIHEHIPLRDDINMLEIKDMSITHKKEQGRMDTGRNLKIYEKFLQDGVELTSRDTWLFARELRRNNRNIESLFYLNKIQSIGGETSDICFDRGLIYEKLNQRDNALCSFIDAFKFGIPRAEVFCHIGYYFKDKDENEVAISYFNLAIDTVKTSSFGFTFNDYWEYTPHIQLADCYLKLNNIEKAAYHHDIAKKYKPNSKDVSDMENFIDKIKSIGHGDQILESINNLEKIDKYLKNANQLKNSIQKK